jgi:predicted Zn-dependent peptidase
VLVEEREIEQTNIALSTQAIGRRDPDRYALGIMNAVLGSGMSSRLFKEVRERRGLAYAISSGAWLMRDIGALMVNAGVSRTHQEEALKVIVAELHRLVNEPVSEEELQRAIDYVTGSLLLSQETARAVGQRNGNQLLMDEELEPIEEAAAEFRTVTTADVQRVAKRIIGPGESALAVVGPSASADRLDAILSN